MPKTTTPKPPPVGPGSDEMFTFASSLGEVVAHSLNAGPVPNPLAFTAAREANDPSRIMLLLTRAKTSPEVFARLCSLPADELARFYEAWGAHSGITVGESPAS